MDRRSFLKRLGLASAGAVVAYSFPKIIVPKNIIPVQDSWIFRVSDDPNFGFGFSGLDVTTLKEIYPQVIEDNFFKESGFMAYCNRAADAYLDMENERIDKALESVNRAFFKRV